MNISTGLGVLLFSLFSLGGCACSNWNTNWSYVRDDAELTLQTADTQPANARMFQLVRVNADGSVVLRVGNPERLVAGMPGQKILLEENPEHTRIHTVTIESSDPAKQKAKVSAEVQQQMKIAGT